MRGKHHLQGLPGALLTLSATGKYVRLPYMYVMLIRKRIAAAELNCVPVASIIITCQYNNV